MNLTRFNQIVESYGSDPSRWPIEERVAAEAFAESSEEAKESLAKGRLLDDQLDLFVAAVDIDPGALKANVFNRLQEDKRPSGLTQIVDWLLPDVSNLPQTLWRPAIAAAMPLVIGIIIGLYNPDSSLDIATEEELYLLGLSNAEWEDLQHEE